ncbi:glycoside hydrolase family 16 protein [Pseudoflavitalea sp. G-6-1-2]|uniref:glycoside hydrolase family 16 protein n=1 Tax=Pseudoflavitalea sp. G-6-1-2 TaxID=2728841 RepID=UPI00146AAF53|nr:glycoside hydrolase family 16 protein [Pseudoflavitalea sp. G-6-1-2]NML21180.1 glycoside hydrolase family 16 protein [Pseudoflavitalea sp. G-6-1-2]
MKRLLLCFIATIVYCGLATAQASKAKKWKMVWREEFNYTGLPDARKWSYATGRSGWGNNELQNYTANDSATANVKNGYLHVIANRHISGSDTSYTSARLLTKNKGEWKYGKIEVRAKVARGKGICSAIWMMPTEGKYGGWPSSGEIDIMEYVPWNADSIYQTIHTGAYNHIKGTQKGARTFVDDAPADFHTYGIEWTAESIDYFLDGVLRYRFPNEHKTSAEWPYDHPFHLITNISVGGKFEGRQGLDTAVFPVTMQIDYIRVYREKN